MAVNAIGSSGFPARMPEMPSQQPFTEDQKATVESILSEYDASDLTSEDATAIHAAFQEAGITPGFGLFQMIEDAGFDAETLRELDPSIPAGGPKGAPPPPPDAGFASGLNKEAVSELQEILEKYDLENLTEDDESSLVSELESSGFLFPGLMMNYSA